MKLEAAQPKLALPALEAVLTPPTLEVILTPPALQTVLTPPALKVVLVRVLGPLMMLSLPRPKPRRLLLANGWEPPKRWLMRLLSKLAVEVLMPQLRQPRWLEPLVRPPFFERHGCLTRSHFS